MPVKISARRTRTGKSSLSLTRDEVEKPEDLKTSGKKRIDKRRQLPLP